MESACSMSSCGRFRYSLDRVWGDGGRIALFVMLNPSIADHTINDPTVLRCIDFAKKWGYDGIRIVNLCSWRATDPDDMYDFINVYQLDKQIAYDMSVLSVAAGRKDVAIIICAWGKVRPVLKQYAVMAHVAMRMKRKTFAIKLNSDGSPAHPLYLKGDLTPIPFEPLEVTSHG